MTLPYYACVEGRKRHGFSKGSVVPTRWGALRKCLHCGDRQVARGQEQSLLYWVWISDGYFR